LGASPWPGAPAIRRAPALFGTSQRSRANSGRDSLRKMTLLCEPPTRSLKATPDSTSYRFQCPFEELKAAEDIGEYQKLRDQLIECHRPLVRRLARRYHTDDYLREDLESEGICALILAIAKFDPQSGVPFEAFVVIALRTRMSDYLSRNGDSCARGKAARRLSRIRRAVRDDGRSVDLISDGELAILTGMGRRSVSNLRPHLNAYTSVDAKSEESDGLQLRDSDDVLAPDSLQAKEEMDWIQGAVQRLPWRERFIVRSLFGLDGSKPSTPSDIAPLFGVSRQRVSQLLKQAISRLRIERVE
jgi:RNA polymerase sigma factor (sigma-70 family)